MDLETLKYPVGQYKTPQPITTELLHSWIKTIQDFPTALKQAIENLDSTQLDTPYREGGWTIRQLIHHLADSHLNSYIRFKLGITEDEPNIKPYQEAKWAEIEEAKTLSVVPSLSILEGLHTRWVATLQQFTPEDWKRKLIHPEYEQPLTLDELLGLYDWHCRHHLTHITNLRARKQWD